MPGLNVLHIIPSICDGGIERMLLSQYSKKSDASLVSVLTLKPVKSNQIDDFRKIGLKVYSPLNASNFKYPFFLLKLFRKYNFNVIHLHLGESSWKILLLVLILNIKVKIFVHSHNFYLKTNSSLKTKITHEMTNILMKIMPVRRLACSKEAGDWLFRDDKNFSIIKNSFNTDNFLFSESVRSSTRESLGIDVKDKVAIFIGRLEQQKQPIEAIKFFQEDRIYNFKKLIIIGDGGLAESLKEYADDKGISDDIFFLNSTNNVEKFLFAADCFIAPSLYEGLGIAALEAYISGMDVILSSAFPDEVRGLEGVKHIEDFKIANYKKTAHKDISLRQELSFYRLEIINKLGYCAKENELFKLHKKSLSH